MPKPAAEGKEEINIQQQTAKTTKKSKQIQTNPNSST
jgi:hypothetical protein